MMEENVPSIENLKQQARAIRQTLARSGTAISHAQALEKTAHQWGARDWNTLVARQKIPPTPPIQPQVQQSIPPRWQIGQRVRGQYIGQAFDGAIKSATHQSGGFWRLVVVFDTAVDVVTSDHFSNFRKQVAFTLNSQGVSPAATSDKEPQMRLFAA